MKISDILNTLRAERIFGRTPSGRSLTDYTIKVIDATIEDKKNYDSEAMFCKNCRFIGSSLLANSGCPNCGGKDCSFDINTNQLLQI